MFVFHKNIVQANAAIETEGEKVDETKLTSENARLDAGTTVDSTPTHAQQQPQNIPTQSKRVIGFGLQNFGSVDDEQTKFNWNVVVCLHDGQTAILSLPNLRKVFKGMFI